MRLGWRCTTCERRGTGHEHVCGRDLTALDTSNAQEAGHRVHQVVAKEMRSLDPTATTEVTGYFNHSYVPGSRHAMGERAGRQFERQVFLRHSLRSSRASGDLENFDRNDATAFFLSLAQEEPDEETQRVRARASQRQGSRVLVTTVPALDDLTPTDDSPRIRCSDWCGRASYAARRVRLSSLTWRTSYSHVVARSNRQELEAFSETVSAVFTEDAVLRINRVFGIVEQALAKEPSVETLLLSGRLTESRKSVNWCRTC